jgi:hypothetical protein
MIKNFFFYLLIINNNLLNLFTSINIDIILNNKLIKNYYKSNNYYESNNYYPIIYQPFDKNLLKIFLKLYKFYKNHTITVNQKIPLRFLRLKIFFILLIMTLLFNWFSIKLLKLINKKSLMNNYIIDNQSNSSNSKNSLLIKSLLNEKEIEDINKFFNNRSNSSNNIDNNYFNIYLFYNNWLWILLKCIFYIIITVILYQYYLQYKNINSYYFYIVLNYLIMGIIYDFFRIYSILLISFFINNIWFIWDLIKYFYIKKNQLINLFISKNITQDDIKLFTNHPDILKNFLNKKEIFILN